MKSKPPNELQKLEAQLKTYHKQPTKTNNKYENTPSLLPRTKSTLIPKVCQKDDTVWIISLLHALLISALSQPAVAHQKELYNKPHSPLDQANGDIPHRDTDSTHKYTD